MTAQLIDGKAIAAALRACVAAEVRRLAQQEGIFAGISTGANVVGAHGLAERLGSQAVIVTLAVDTGFKYMSVAPYAEF